VKRALDKDNEKKHQDMEIITNDTIRELFAAKDRVSDTHIL